MGYLNSKRWSKYFDLDLIVYVFCENDTGDNIKEIMEKSSKFRPFAQLTDDGFVIDTSNMRLSKSAGYRMKSWMARHFLFFRFAHNRLALFFKYGPKLKASEADRKMATKARQGELPNQNDLPSTWPAELRERAQRTASAILLRWASDAKMGSRPFTILYVPRESEIKKETKNQDSWKAWLESFCNDNDISFIDPTHQLLETQNSGKAVFGDHFTVEGHEAFANAFIEWFKERHGKS